MAKRKRLAPANPLAAEDLETKVPVSGWASVKRRPAPIADVASDAAGQAAFEEVASALNAARKEGRLIQQIPVADIQRDHLLRDRINLDPEDMVQLEASLSARGQQTPIEVVTLPEGGYGLISGWRRLEALTRLGKETALALVRRPEGSEATYVAMVEENEIRANLSFYERARITAEAARIGVYSSAQEAVQGLFAHASASKKSKILSFVKLYEALGCVLRFPTQIPEKLGLALVRAIETTPAFGARLRDALRHTPAVDALAERAALERALMRASGEAKGKQTSSKGLRGEEVARGVFLKAGRGKVVLSGAGLDTALLEDLRLWLSDRQA